MDPVREQYEALPYPIRDPADEKKRLLRTWLDDLPMISHYGFGGRAPFGDGFRVLVAGGGTGDAAIFLAEQLRNTKAEVVYLDVSTTSLGIAQRRAQERGLANIRWIHDSLLNLASLGLGKFDYINCVGVLHHLDDPDAGLRALLEVLGADGVLGLMVYGRYGRTGVYQVQDLMKLIDEPGATRADRIDHTKQILGALPKSNWFKRGEDLYSDHQRGDAGLYDLFLHSHDKAYTVGELYAWLEDTHGLTLELTDVQCGRAAYLPAMLLGPKPPRIAKAIKAMPARRQHEIAELLSGRIQTHSFFATRKPGRAPYGDTRMIPFFFHEPLTGPDLARVFAPARGRSIVLDHAHTGIAFEVNPGRYGPDILQHVDGQASFGTIFDRVRAQHAVADTALSNATLFEDFREVYDAFNALERLLLRAPA
jgi:SAM-dependent methyltransferase